MRGWFEGQRPTLSVVVPVYRSEECLQALVAAIEASLGAAGVSFELILVNDFSPDGSWRVIESLCRSRPNIVGIDLRKNFGQDNALMTGLRHSRGRYVAIMDDDLQHDPADLPALLKKIEEGHDLVYARFRTKKQRLWKNLGSWFNGVVANVVVGKPKGVYISPYKLIRREVVEAICAYDGPDPYVDGLLFQVTARIVEVPVEHHERHAGVSTYTFVKSLRVWARLACSFSHRPLRLVTYAGFSAALVGLVLAATVVAYRLLRPQDFSEYATGWASLMIATLVLSGFQMIFIGVLGEYVGRTFVRVNNKPQTSIHTVLNGEPVPRREPAGEESAPVDQPHL